MNISTWLKTSTNKLKSAGIATARLDCLVLLEDVVNLPRIKILAETIIELNSQDLKKLDNMISKRINHTPLSYIRGKTEFYGREFILDENVLEPRPESETMIDLLITINNIETVIDIGTGSGALAVTAKLENPLYIVKAIDIDPECINVAKANIDKYELDIELRIGNLFEPFINSKFKNLAILANLPYVPNKFTINQAAMNEPKIAIFGGEDGLDYYRTLFKQLKTVSSENLYVLCESLPTQHIKLKYIAEQNGFDLKTSEDFIQLFTRN